MLYFSKTYCNVFIILHLNNVDTISLQIRLHSKLEALVCENGVHRNLERRKQMIWRNLVRSSYEMTSFDVIFLKKINYTSVALSSECFLSHVPMQLIGRAGFSG